MAVVVWEWELDALVWVPYGPKVCHFLEDKSKNGEDTVDMGKVDSRLSCYEVSLKKETQTRIETGTERKIRRKTYPSSHPCSSGVLWKWLSDFGWIPYDMDTTFQLEGAHLIKPILDLQSLPLGIPNYVDFKKEVQVNWYTGGERPIKRKRYRTQYPSDSGQGSAYSHNPLRVALPSLLSSSSPTKSSLSHNVSSSPSKTSAGGPLSPSKYLTRSSSLPRKCSQQKSLSSSKSLSPTSSLSPIKSSLEHNPSSPSKTGVGRSSSSNHYMRSLSLPSGHNILHGSAQSSAMQYLSLNNDVASGERSQDEKKRDEEKRKRVKLPNNRNEDPLSSFCRDAEEAADEECSICFEKLKDVSGFHDDSSKPPSSDVKELKKCKHKFHGTCLRELVKSASKNEWMQCPTCKTIQGIKHGNQPKDGTMHVSRSSHSLPGHHGYGMITITYDFRTGLQDSEYPHPGKLYYASGFPRVCYLPDNNKGQKVLKLLKKAWERRLIFTVATSNTTGQEDTVVWNEIHHKTEAFSNISGHGFPDPNYLDNVLAELAIQGVDDSDDDDSGAV